MSQTSVFGIVKSHSQAERLVEELQAAGFPASEISVLLPDSEGRHDIGHVKATKAPEGATTGATAGGVTGGVLGLLAGIGALAIPGIGPFIAAGPLMAALSGAAIGAGTGGLVGGLVGMGIPEIEAKRYQDKLKRGNYLIAVAADSDEKDRAKEIFKNVGAEDISTSSMSKAPAESRV
jgi:Predicted membrane protein